MNWMTHTNMVAGDGADGPQRALGRERCSLHTLKSAHGMGEFVVSRWHHHQIQATKSSRFLPTKKRPPVFSSLRKASHLMNESLVEDSSRRVATAGAAR